MFSVVGMMRAGAQNPPAPSKVDTLGRTRSKLAIAAALATVKGRKRFSRSSSDSSESSSSDSDSSGSSSSSSRDGSPPPRRASGKLIFYNSHMIQYITCKLFVAPPT